MVMLKIKHTVFHNNFDSVQGGKKIVVLEKDRIVFLMTILFLWLAIGFNKFSVMFRIDKHHFGLAPKNEYIFWFA